MREPAAPAAAADVEPHPPTGRRALTPNPLPVLAAVSAGGVLGSLARHGVWTAWPHPPAGFAWSTWVVNVSGCLLIGVLMVLLGRVFTAGRLLRPFLGVGVLGGYTTFSTHIVDAGRAATAGAAGLAMSYLAATLLAAMLAVWAGTAVTERALRALRSRRAAR